MTPQALVALIANDEDTRHQSKRDFAHVDSLATELVVFANGLGGTLLIGVEDDDSVRGLSLQEVSRLNQIEITSPGTVIDLVEEAMAFMQKNLHVRFEITGTPARQEIWDYPLVALREALINAICHRDYGNTADIQIKIFENSLHIWIPGTLPFDVSVADLLDPVHASRPRNKLMAQVFFDLGLIERYGGGIQRILAACESAGLPPPELENAQGGFRMVFKQAEESRQTPDPIAKSAPPEVTTEVLRMLALLQGEMTRKELMQQLGLRDEKHFRQSYQQAAIALGAIEMTLPDTPRSRLQKYRLTQAGQQWLDTRQPHNHAPAIHRHPANPVHRQKPEAHPAAQAGCARRSNGRPPASGSPQRCLTPSPSGRGRR